MFEWFSHAEIFQFILLSNSKTRAPVLSTCRAQFCRPQWLLFMFEWFSQAEIFQFILLSNRKTRAPVLSTCRALFCRPQAFVLHV